MNRLLGKVKANLGDLTLWITNHVVAHVPSHSFRETHYRWIMKYEIGAESAIFMGAEFDARRGFFMGRGSVINQNCRLDTRGGIRIGNHVSISAQVCILTADHDLKSIDFRGRTKSVEIEDFVFVGTGALILPGVRLGRGCAVGAGAVVTHNVDDYTIVAGNPAQKIGMRPESFRYTCAYRRPWH